MNKAIRRQPRRWRVDNALDVAPYEHQVQGTNAIGWRGSALHSKRRSSRRSRSACASQTVGVGVDRCRQLQLDEGGFVTRSNVNEQQAEQQSPVEQTAQLANGSQSAGVQKLHHLVKQSGGTPPDPSVVVQLLDSAPGDQHAMMIVIQQTYGNAYVQRVVSQSRLAPLARRPNTRMPRRLVGLQRPRDARRARKCLVRR